MQDLRDFPDKQAPAHVWQWQDSWTQLREPGERQGSWTMAWCRLDGAAVLGRRRHRQGKACVRGNATLRREGAAQGGL